VQRSLRDLSKLLDCTDNQNLWIANVPLRPWATENGDHLATRGLASLGVLAEPLPRQYALTSVGELLRSDVPQRAIHNWCGAPAREESHDCKCRTGRQADECQ
jgi:hypothetical protein